MIGFLYGDSDAPILCEYDVCDVCDGKGKHVNPAIDAHGISMQEFDEDPDFEASYWHGHYDVTCYRCGGKRVIPVPVENEDQPTARAAYDDAIFHHLDYIAEMEAERRAGA
jgi:hypothetical protein